MAQTDGNRAISAEVLHIQLLLPDRITVKYRSICKKHAKLHLLNQIVQKHQLFRVNEFLSVRILAINSVWEDDDVLDEVLAAQNCIIISTTRILFVSYDGSNSCSRTYRETNERINPGTHRKHKQINREEIYPDKQCIISVLKQKIIAEDKFINKIANSITNGLNQDLTDFRGNGIDSMRSAPFTMSAGIILQSDMGGGKTTLLRTLHELYGTKRSKLFSSKGLVGMNKGDVESTILNLFMECIASGCRLILIDDVDVLVPEVNASSSASDLYSSSALIHGIDTMAQRYNTESHRSEDRKIFIFATCTYHREIRQSLLVPHRLGDVSKILYLPFPSQKLRCSLILSLLTCTGIDIIWDIHTEGTKDTVTGGSAMRSMDERGDGGADLVRDDGTGRGSIIPKVRGTHKEERIHGSPVLTNSTNLFKTGRRLSGHFPDIIAAADHLGPNRAFDLALALSHSTQGTSVSDLMMALKDCFTQNICSLLFSQVIRGLLPTSSKAYCAPTLTKSTVVGDRISVRASDFVYSIGEIRPTVALKNDILSLLIDNSEKKEKLVLLCVEALQNKLINAVLMPYVDSNHSHQKHNSNSRRDAGNGRDISRQKGLSLSHCSGVLIHGPSSCGKTSLACWLAQEGQKHFKFLSVACADLVHKVVGESEKKLSEVFAAARKIAPCFLLLDNLEIILGSGTVGSGEEEGGGRTRKRTAHQALDRLLSTLLVEIDGLSSSRTLSKFKHVAEQREGGTDLEGNGEGEEDEQEYKPVIVIATTSDIRLIDRSLIRPGRLEEHVAMELPSEAERTIMLKYFHEQMLTRGEKFRGAQMSGEQCDIIRKARETMDLDSMDKHVPNLRSASELKNFLQEKAMSSIRALTDAAPLSLSLPRPHPEDSPSSSPSTVGI